MVTLSLQHEPKPLHLVEDIIERARRAALLDSIAEPLTEMVKRSIPSGSLWKDLLSGTPVGHPLHPILTDIPIGSFTSATVLDIVGGRRSRRAAGILVALGLMSAVPTAAAGLADWSDTHGEEKRLGVVHAASNTLGLGLYALSLFARVRGRAARGATLAVMGMGAMTVGGYLGGHLTFARGVGVNTTFAETPPDEWMPVLDEADLVDGQPIGVDVGAARVLLCRVDGLVLAIGARCTHAGGPLDEGDVDTTTGCVTCPWHGSVFSLADGSVVHGPASVPAAAYEVRVDGGKIAVRGAMRL